MGLALCVWWEKEKKKAKESVTHHFCAKKDVTNKMLWEEKFRKKDERKERRKGCTHTQHVSRGIANDERTSHARVLAVGCLFFTQKVK